MSGLAVALEAVHLLRPLWTLALVPIVALWWLIRSGQMRPAPASGIAPHLRRALTVGGQSRARLLPIDGVALTLALLALGAAGPTWSRQPDPFVAQSAPLVIALDVSAAMQVDDIAPSRLERGKQKIRDLLDLRAGARTALVAYAGSAHVTVPMTEDPGVMLPYLAGLSPEIMPEAGNRAAEALPLAQDLLAREDGPGAVLYVTGGLDPADAPALSDAGAIVLAVRPEGAPDRGLDALPGVIEVSTDRADVTRIDRMLDAAQARAALEDRDRPWLDRGPWLAWPAALLTLMWFRRGSTMRWIMVALAVSFSAGETRADGIADWFFTPDQQGRLAVRRGDFEAAADLFVDPLWRGYALYRDGQYAAAAQVLSRVESTEADFIAGLANLKGRAYRDGVRAFETVLSRDPDHPGAAENLATAREIVAYIEELQEATDTGEDRGIGADEVVYDNESGRGAETRIEGPEEDGAGLLTAETWMATVDTRTGDFLRLRFALEAAGRSAE